MGSGAQMIGLKIQSPRQDLEKTAYPLRALGCSVGKWDDDGDDSGAYTKWADSEIKWAQTERAEHSARYTLRAQGERATGLHNLSPDLLSEVRGCRVKAIMGISTRYAHTGKRPQLAHHEDGKRNSSYAVSILHQLNSPYTDGSLNRVYMLLKEGSWDRSRCSLTAQALASEKARSAFHLQKTGGRREAAEQERYHSPNRTNWIPSVSTYGIY